MRVSFNEKFATQARRLDIDKTTQLGIELVLVDDSLQKVK